MTDVTGKEEGHAGDSSPLSPARAPSQAGAGETSSVRDAVEEAHIIEEVVIPAPGVAKTAAEKPLQPVQPTPAPSIEEPRIKSEDPEKSINTAAREHMLEPPIQELSKNDPLNAIQLPKTDIQKVLNEIKLPERRIVPGETLKVEVEPTPPALSTVPANPVKAGDAAELPRDSVDMNVNRIVEHVSSIVAPLRTLKNDFQDIVRDKKMSLVRAAALEQDKKHGGEYAGDAKGTQRRASRVIFAAVLLAILGSAAFFGVAFVIGQRGGTPVSSSDTSLLFTETTIPLSIDNRSAFDIKEILAQARAQSGTVLGSITRIVPMLSTGLSASPDASGERAATLEEFFSILNVRVSPELIRALNNEFFLGLHTVDENAPLLVIPVLSYERAFAGMLEWESTMNADLAPAFTAVPDTEIGADGTLAKRQFRDIVMRNYDVRALTDNAGTIQLYYSFPTRNILIIAESPYSFAEILSRLRAERKL